MLALLPLCALAAGSDGFICDGGRVHPLAHLNDDYCDCSDGSDERATGACPDTTFRCENSPHMASVLFASRVNDGVCDCCDGSDETRVTDRADAAGGARAPLCPNRCVSLASEAVGSLVRGLKERGKRSRAGQEEAAQRGERVLQARGELADTEAEMREATAHLTRAEEVEAERMAERVRRLEGGEVERAIRLDEMTQEQLARALVQLALAQQVHGVDKLHEMLSAEAAEEMEEVDAADLMELAMEARDAAGQSTGGAEGEEPPPTSGERECVVNSPCAFEEQLIALLPFHAMSKDFIKQMLLAFARETKQMHKLAQTCELLWAEVDKALDQEELSAALELLQPFVDVEADGARAVVAELSKREHKAKDELSSLEPVQAMEPHMGAHQEWYALYGKCYEVSSDNSFKYKLCPFSQLKQPLYGEAMSFTNGDDCPVGRRNASVVFECGEEDRLLSVVEPSTCVYQAVFRSPSACVAEGLRAKLEEISRASLEVGVQYEIDEDTRALLAL